MSWSELETAANAMLPRSAPLHGGELSGAGHRLGLGTRKAAAGAGGQVLTLSTSVIPLPALIVEVEAGGTRLVTFPWEL